LRIEKKVFNIQKYLFKESYEVRRKRLGSFHDDGGEGGGGGD
jgi:hypothetical protein